MRYAIVESGGKQYRAVEGELLEVDRLPVEAGKQINLDRVLLLADGDQFQVGMPTLGGVEVKATVVQHFSGPKVVRFRYSPKKRIRVRGGHRQQYTRLLVDFVGGRGEVRDLQKPEAPPVAPRLAKDAVGEAGKRVPQKPVSTKKRTASKAVVKKSSK